MNLELKVVPIATMAFEDTPAGEADYDRASTERM